MGAIDRTMPKGSVYPTIIKRGEGPHLTLHLAIPKLRENVPSMGAIDRTMPKGSVYPTIIKRGEGPHLTLHLAIPKLRENVPSMGAMERTSPKDFVISTTIESGEGDPLDAPLGNPKIEGKCSVDGCDGTHNVKGLCKFHYQRKRRGTPLDAPLRNGNVPIGHKRKDAKGYISIKVEANRGWRKGKSAGRWMYEHRYVFENEKKGFNRSLKDEEIVHHKNNISDDNRIENLELRLKNNHPPGARVKDLVAYANEIRDRYGDNPNDW